MASFSLHAREVIQPTVYASDNQQMTLAVVPLRPDGTTGAQYTLVQNGASLWSRKLPFTATKVHISQAGMVGLCANSKGLNPVYNGVGKAHLGDMVLKVIDAQGQTSWSQTSSRSNSMRIHGAPEPYCQQVLFQPDNQQVYFWFQQAQKTQLMVVDATAGSIQKPTHPAWLPMDEKIHIRDIKYHNSGSPGLFLVEATGERYEENETGQGVYVYLTDTFYYLLDTAGHVYWQKQLLGSLDMRTTKQGKQLQAAYQQRDAFLKGNDLLQVNQADNSFVITDYIKQQHHSYRISQSKQVQATGATSMQLKASPFEAEVIMQSTPQLLDSIAINAVADDGKTPCEHKFEAVDVLSDGRLLLYDQDRSRVAMVSAGKFTADFLVVPEAMFKQEVFGQALMFVGAEDHIYVNLGHNAYAVYDQTGRLLETRQLTAACTEFCVTNQVVQKTTGQLWQQHDQLGLSLLRLQDDHWWPRSNTLTDSNGRWFEYIYSMQSDDLGRLMMLGRINDALNQLYVLNPDGKPVNTMDLGYGYTSSATMAGTHVFISEYHNNQIAMLSTEGALAGRFTTENKSTPYLLQAHQNRLYAITPNAILVYQIAHEATHF